MKVITNLYLKNNIYISFAALFIIIYCVYALVPDSSKYSTFVIASSFEFHTNLRRSIHRQSGTALYILCKKQSNDLSSRNALRDHCDYRIVSLAKSLHLHHRIQNWS